jgi:hypothetical protein
MTSPLQWATSVTELLAIFHDALAVLVPIADRARIRWRDGEAYDDWDSIGSALFENVVVRSIKNSNVQLRQAEFAPYDTLIRSYRRVAFISVEGPAIPRGVRAAFLGFGGLSPSLDQVKWIEVLATGESGGPTPHLAPYGETAFSVVHWEDETPMRTDTITIDL